MYTILIVDDEKKEREGIRHLLERYGFDLEVTLAANGEDALLEFEKRDYDVLLTDIKMPFMDGIQLIKEVQERGKNPICIIYSAYGEFEYVKNAISLGVVEYLLKPLRLDAFEELFIKIMDRCKARDEREKEKEQIKQAYEEVVTYKLNLSLLRYLESESAEYREKNFSCLEKIIGEMEKWFDFESNVCIPVLISCCQNQFPMEWEAYQLEIEKQLGGKMLIINKTDNQILVVLVREKKSFQGKELKIKCETFIEQSEGKYQTEVFVVIGSAVDSLKFLKKEYEDIKKQTDYQFFASGSMLIVNDEFYFFKKEKNLLALYFERIFCSAQMEDYVGIKNEFEKVFAYIEKQNRVSSIYVKYTFSEAVKGINEYTKSDINILAYVERIYSARSFNEVSKIVCEFLDNIVEQKRVDRKDNRLIRMAKDIIYERYGDSGLNVSAIAEELQVSVAYLSGLFKRETGENLVKFITRYRVEKSKELLRQSNRKVSDISADVGYVSVSYYISIFRSLEGCSPLQYRERSSENS